MAIVFAGTVIFSPSLALDTTLIVQDAGAPRTFEVALDELTVSKGDQRRIPAKISPRSTLREMSREVVRRKRERGEDAELVLYEVVKGRRTENRRVVTTGVYLKVNPGENAREMALQSGAVGIRSTEAGPWEWVAVASNSVAALELAVRLRDVPGVLAAEPMLARQQTKKITPNDPHFSNQWHLRNTGQFNGVADVDVNITNVWTSFRGTNIYIAIIDDGLQTAHPDLAANVDTDIDWDFNFDDNNPNPGMGDDHGTACAGIAAAVGNNNLGVSGAAPEARLVGLRLISLEATDEQEAAAMNWSNSIIQIKSNSWGPSDNGATLEAPGPLTVAAFSNACIHGRDGLGVLNFWAGGNGLQAFDDSNFDGYANSIYTIAVGAVGNTGVQSWYSEPGANLVVVAPSSGYNLLGANIGTWTTDRTGSSGYASGDYTGNFGGTSSSTPLAAGVGALMLQANPNLGWRDVQEIFFRSARRNHQEDTGWRPNGAGFWFNHKYGGGMVDAESAVAMAQSWTNLGPQLMVASNQTGLNVSIPDNDPVGITRSFTITNSMRIEHVVVTVTLTHTYRGDLRVELISPANTTSVLANVRNDSNDNYVDWSFMTIHNWGESSAGEWTLRIADVLAQDTGNLLAAGLTIYGSEGELAENQPPVFYPIDHKTIFDGNNLTFEVKATDPVDHDPISLTAESLPPGSTFGSTNEIGTFTWNAATPTGTYDVVFLASDKDGTNSLQVTITILENASGTPPVLHYIGDKIVAAGSLLEFVVTATATEGDEITLSVSNLPGSAVFNTVGTAGTFIWTNAGPIGVYTSSFHAADKDGVSSEEILIHVIPPGTGCYDYVGFTNSAPIHLRDQDTANPYPSTINVSGITSPVSKVTITLHDVNHTYFNDLDALVVSPLGSPVLLFSAVADGPTPNTVTLTFDREADNVLPLMQPINSGVYLPTSYYDSTMPDPAPPGSYTNELDAFEDVSPNGEWSLYIADFAEGDTGTVYNGWSILFQLNVACEEEPPEACGIIISEYIEGTGDNKAIELFNGSAETINLVGGNYALEFYFDGDTNPGTVISLTGMVEVGATYIVATSNASAAILGAANQLSDATWFNGSEPVVLRAGTNVVDSIGQVGSTNAFGLEVTLVRKSSVVIGDVIADDAFAATNQWLQFPLNTFSGLGNHSMNCEQLDGDIDGDGIPDTWEYIHFGSLTNANAISDWDDDGFIDLHEYLAGTDPKDPDSYLRAVDVVAPSETNVIIYWTGITGKSYSLSRATNLLEQVYSVIASNIPGVEPLNVHTDEVPVSGGSHYRIELEP